MTDALLIGSGDLGTQIGLTLAARGVRVVAMRRRGGLVPKPLEGISADLADGLPQLPTMAGAGGGPELLVVCLTAGGRDESDYRATFLEAMGRALGDVRERGWAPRRAVFISSTSVCAGTGHVGEATPPSPESSTAVVLLEAERAFLAGLPEATRGIVVRPSGIYGPGRTWFVDQVRRGVISDPARMTHRVHRDDLAATVVHLLTMLEEPQELYLVTDDAPVRAGEVAAFIAGELGVPTQPEWTALPESGAPERRLVNARLRATGFEFTYPTYAEGYRAVLSGDGVRHL